MIRPFKGVWPRLGRSVFVDASAQVIGDVELGDHASVWMNAVVRGDIHSIRIGAYTNVQDNCVIHVQQDEFPESVGHHVTIGHLATLHGCAIERCCLIGMGATVLNGARVGEESILAAGTVVSEGADIPPRSLVVGIPGRVRRPISDRERDGILLAATSYAEYKDAYLAEPEAASPPGTPSQGRP